MSITTRVTKKALVRPRCRSGSNIERGLKEMRCECGVNLIEIGMSNLDPEYKKKKKQPDCFITVYFAKTEFFFKVFVNNIVCDEVCSKFALVICDSVVIKHLDNF